MKRIKNLLILIVLLIPLYGNAKSTKNTVNIYFFHSNTCPHCQEEKKVLDIIEKKYENVKIYKYEIHDEKNKIIFNEIKNNYSINTSGVPITIIGSQVYTGYNKDISPRKFIKTINYFSKYNYDDKAMKVINPNYISTYHESPYINKPTLKSFMKSYNNYKILGIETDSLQPSIIAILIGIITNVTPIAIISLLLILLLLKNISGLNNKMLILVTYYIAIYLLIIEKTLKIDIITLIIYLLLMIIFMYNLFKYFQNKKKKYIYLNIVLIISILTEYINNYFYHRYITILNDISALNILNGLDMPIYYLEYFISILLSFIGIILLIYLFFEKNKRKT